jgi:YggT family protein
MIRFILNIYVWLLILDVILSYIPQARAHQATLMIKKLADYSCRPVRKLLPPDLPFDFSPVVVIIAIQLIIALW